MPPEPDNNPPPHPGPFRHATRDEPLIPHSEGGDWSRFQTPAILVILVILGISAFLLVRDPQRRNPVIQAEVERANSVPTTVEGSLPAWILPYPRAVNPSVIVQPAGSNVAHIYQFLTSDSVQDVVTYYREIFAAKGLVSLSAPLGPDGKQLASSPPAATDPQKFSAADPQRLRSVDIIGTATSAPGQTLIILNYLADKTVQDR